MEYSKADQLRNVQEVVKQTKKYARSLQTQDVVGGMAWIRIF